MTKIEFNLILNYLSEREMIWEFRNIFNPTKFLQLFFFVCVCVCVCVYVRVCTCEYVSMYACVSERASMWVLRERETERDYE